MYKKMHLSEAYDDYSEYFLFVVLKTKATYVLTCNVKIF